ncbi:MAG TPA: ABC transporter permease [Solirubrobacterales bacterium]|nr:ABC transporter permease [Solirubrobacterales bacterium]
MTDVIADNAVKRSRPGIRGGSALRGRYELLGIPALVLVLVLFVYPLVTMLGKSFDDFLVTEQGHGVFANYQWFFGQHVNVLVLQRTLVTALAVTAICLAVSYPFAYLMTLVGERTRLVMTGAVLLSFWTSLMVRNYAWLILLQDNGVVNRILGSLGLPRLHVIGTAAGAAIGMCQILLPFMILPLYANLRGIDRRLLQAAQSLGARPAVAWWLVYAPLSVPGVVAGSLLVFVMTLGFYITPAILGSPTNAMFSQLIVTQVQTLLAFGRGGAMAAVLLVATLLLLGCAALVTRRARSRGVVAT